PSPVPPGEKDLLRADNLWLRYARDGRWVLRGLDLAVAAGEVRALVGSNGCGKSTLLGALAGTLRAQRGRVRNAAADAQALLPQSPRALLACETVAQELTEWRRGGGYGAAEVEAALGRTGLASAAERHPYDLSGGQQQLLALEKLLLLRPRLLLLDEPTKGLDDAFRARVAARVAAARDAGATVVVATHDLGFVRAVADTVSLLFDGEVAVTEPTATFFERSWLYRA
ncbi:ATP-binding cassette domain-containing protein, partial [Olsenella profusa]